MTEKEDELDYIFCIQSPYAGKDSHSICGKFVGAEFHFTSIDHVYCTMKAKGRQLPCKKCLKEVLEVLGGG